MNQTQAKIFHTNRDEMKKIAMRFELDLKRNEPTDTNIMRFIYSSNSRTNLSKLFQDQPQSDQKQGQNSDEIEKVYVIKKRAQDYPQYNEIPIGKLKQFFHEKEALIFSNISPIDPTINNLKTKSNVKFIDLSNTIITTRDFFKRIFAFKQLTSLSLQNIGLIDIPPSLYKLPPLLRNLDLSSNFISSLSDKIKWEQLEGLNLSKNCLQKWPAILDSTTMPNLITFSISFNEIGNDDEMIECFPKIENLNISYCSLLKFPTWICKSKTIRSLDISGNSSIVDFSLSIINEMESLRFLNLSNVHINENDKIDNVKSLNKIIKIIARQTNHEDIKIENCVIVYE